MNKKTEFKRSRKSRERNFRPKTEKIQQYGVEKELIRTKQSKKSILLLDDNNPFNESLIENALSSILISWIRRVVKVGFVRLNPNVDELTKFNPDIVIIDQKTSLKKTETGKIYTGDEIIPIIQKLFPSTKIYLMTGDSVVDDTKADKTETRTKTDKIISRQEDLHEKFMEILELI